MKTAYKWLADLVAVGVLVQAAAIAFGVFGLMHDVDNGATVTKDYNGNAGFAVHAITGTMIIPLLAIALLIVGLIAKFQDSSRFAVYVFGAVLLQVVFAMISFGAPVIGVLHGANALVVLTTAVFAGRKVRAAIAAEGAVSPASVAAATA